MSKLKDYVETFLTKNKIKEYPPNQFQHSAYVRDLLNLSLDELKLPRGNPFVDIANLLKNPKSTFYQVIEGTANEAFHEGFQNTSKFLFPKITQEILVSNFKKVEIKDLENIGLMTQAREHSEPRTIQLFTETVGYSVLKTWVGSFSISRVSLLNDDQSVFSRLPYGIGNQCLRTIENETVNILSSNPVLVDGFNLFSNEHNNTNTTAFGIDSIVDGLKKLGKQVDDDGNILDYKADTLIVPTTLLGDALTLNESTKLFTTVIGSNLLDDISTTKFYILDSDHPPIKLCKLKSEDVPSLYPDTKNITFDGIKLKSVYDFGLVATNYKGIVQAGE